MKFGITFKNITKRENTMKSTDYQIRLKVNKKSEHVSIPANMTLLTMLREKLGLTSVKNGCSAGECGACTVLLNGEPVNSCMVLAAECDGAEIITVDGLSEKGEIIPLQKMMIEKGAIQCGFCTPGMLISAYALLQRNPDPSEDEIKTALVGNLCRCTGYVRIIDAVQSTAALTE
jgi:carbon-monoxide dehydrogenase small subunit